MFKKPSPDFPLFVHDPKHPDKSRWAKKIKGKTVYFGVCKHDPTGERALKKWQAMQASESDEKTEGTTVGNLCDRFLAFKRARRRTDELTTKSLIDYERTCRILINFFGREKLIDAITIEDFERLRSKLAKSRKLVALGNEINRVKIVFTFAHKSRLIDRPMQFGPGFVRPSKRMVRRQDRKERKVKTFTADEIRSLLEVASVQMRAMILLGINCGFGNNDVGNLPVEDIDLRGGWVDFPRPKTGIDRRCKLWPETVEAIKAALKVRPKAKAAKGLVFVTKYGKPWSKDEHDSPVTKEFRKLLEKLGVYRKRRGFYALRHTFETVAGEATDQVAVDHVMGHADPSMAAVYRHGVSGERLEKVAGCVREWLFGGAE